MSSYESEKFLYEESAADDAFIQAINVLEVRPNNYGFESEDDLCNILYSASNLWSTVDQSLLKWTDKSGVSLLGSAARNNYIRVTEFLLSKDADPLFSEPPRKDSNFRAISIASTPLMIALQNSHMEIAEMLLSSLEAKNTKIKNLELIGAALIEVAAKYSDLTHNPLISRIVKLLISCTEGINEPFDMASNADRKCSLLSHVVSLKHFPHLVHRLLEEPDVNTHGEALGVAAHLLDYDMVEMLIEHSSKHFPHLVHWSPEEPDIDTHGEALEVSAHLLDYDAVEMQIEHSRKLTPNDFSEALILACATGGSDAIPVVKLLLKFDASPLYTSSEGSNSVSIATSQCDLELLELLLKEGGDPMDGFEFLTGHDSTIEGEKCLKLLLMHLKTISQASDNSWINAKRGGKPIISIFAMNYIGSFVKIAIDFGANLELKDDEEFRTPLDWACRADNISTAIVLLESGANVNALSGRDSWTAFQTSIIYGSIELVKELLKYKVNLNVQTKSDDYRGCTALHLAVARGDVETIRLILNQPNVDLNVARERNITALMDAVMTTCSDSCPALLDIIEELLKHGANPNIPDQKNNTPLMIAVEESDVDLVRILVENGADIEAKNSTNDSPLSIASETLDKEGINEIMKIMLRSQIGTTSRADSVKFLTGKVKELLRANNDHIIAALCFSMLEHAETRKIITEFPDLWVNDNRAPRKKLRYDWSTEVGLDANLSDMGGPFRNRRRSSFLSETLMLPSSSSHSLTNRVIYPENMLTWAISRKSIVTKVLLQSGDNFKKLPIEWKSNLCINVTTVGTPLRCAVDEENIEAVLNIMDVIKNAWRYQYSHRNKQLGSHHPHLLDHFQHEDFLFVLSAYPTIMVDFLRAATLVPAQTGVSGICRAPIEGNTIWVSLSKERSPSAIWKKFMDENNNFQEKIYKRAGTFFWLPIYKKSNEAAAPDAFDDFVDENVQEVQRTRIRRIYNFLRYMLIERSHIQMRFMLYNKNFPGDFDVVRSAAVCNMVPLFYEISNIESNVEAFVVPVPEFASYNMLFHLVRASEKLKNPSLFESPMVAAVVQLHWRMYALRNHFYNLWLYIGLLVAFMALIFVDQANPEPNVTQKVCIYSLQAFKVLYSIQFIYQELRQLKDAGNLKRYLRDPWNVFDIPAFVLLLIGVAMYFTDDESHVLNALNGVTSLLLWFKLLYFMRPFVYYGPMVYMIFKVIFDIKVFLIILFIVMIGFGNAFFIIMLDRISGISCENENFILTEICGDTVAYPGPFNTIFLAMRSAFSYMLGNYDFADLDEGKYPALLSIIWAFFVVIVAIILLNLLIAIISESYQNVSPMKIPAWRLEQARIIVNIYAGISQEERKSLNKMMVEYPWLQVLAPKTSS